MIREDFTSLFPPVPSDCLVSSLFFHYIERESRESTNSITSAIDFIVFPSLVSFLLNFHPFRHLSLPSLSLSLFSGSLFFFCFLLWDVFLFSLLPVLTHLSWRLRKERKGRRRSESISVHFYPSLHWWTSLYCCCSVILSQLILYLYMKKILAQSQSLWEIVFLPKN